MLGFWAPIVEIGRGRNVGEQGRLEHSGGSQMGCNLSQEGSGWHPVPHASSTLGGGILAILAQLPWVTSSGYPYITSFSSLLVAPGSSSPGP